MSSPPKALSWHARTRWKERVGTALPADLLDRAVLIPPRLALPLWGSYGARLAHAKHGSAGRRTAFRVTASSILVCRGSCVATVYVLPVEELAQVLVWLMLGQWVDE